MKKQIKNDNINIENKVEKIKYKSAKNVKGVAEKNEEELNFRTV